jgi:SAM-dependent methyltransferase
MADKYVLDRTPEIERLERQAHLIGHDRVTDHLDIAPGARVLDAGCGTGWVTRLMAETAPDAQVTGLDLTAHFVDHARQAAAEAGLSTLDYRVGDICDMPFDAETFDLVWSQLVLFFLPHPEKAIAEFARVLKPGGRVKIIVTDGVFEDLWPERAELSDAIRRFRDGVLNRWRLTRIPEMLRAAGLQGIGVEADVDRVYSFTGGASPEQRQNILKSYVQAMTARQDLLGGQAEADRLAAELVAFIDHPESIALSTHWTFTATKP